MLKWISGNTWKDRIQNEKINLKIGVAPIDKKMRESRLKRFDHVQRRPINAPVRKSKLIQVQEIKKFRGRPKIILVEVIKKDLSAKGVIENMTSYRTEWRKRMHGADPK